MSGIHGNNVRIPLIDSYAPLRGHGCVNSQPLLDEATQFEDPVTLEPIMDPVVDECGHTFNRSTIDLIFRDTITGNAADVISCPISRQPIHRNRMVTNYAVKRAIESPQNPIELILAKLESLEVSNKAIVASNKEQTESINSLAGQVTKLNKKFNIRSTQIENVMRLNFCDAFGLLTGCTKMQEIINRGISDDDIRLVNEPPSTSAQLLSSINPREWDASCSQPNEHDDELYGN